MPRKDCIHGPSADARTERERHWQHRATSSFALRAPRLWRVLERSLARLLLCLGPLLPGSVEETLMLQLTFHAQLPNPALIALVHTAYKAFWSSAEQAEREGCLSITLTDLGAEGGIRYRALFEQVGPTDSPIRVITEAVDAHVALRSGWSVLLGSRGRSRSPFVTARPVSDSRENALSRAASQ